jgi:hypothetical protein
MPITPKTGSLFHAETQIVRLFKLKTRLEGHRQVSSCNLGNGIAFGRVGSVRARAF